MKKTVFFSCVNSLAEDIIIEFNQKRFKSIYIFVLLVNAVLKAEGRSNKINWRVILTVRLNSARQE